MWREVKEATATGTGSWQCNPTSGWVDRSWQGIVSILRRWTLCLSWHGIRQQHMGFDSTLVEAANGMPFLVQSHQGKCLSLKPEWWLQDHDLKDHRWGTWSGYARSVLAMKKQKIWLGEGTPSLENTDWTNLQITKGLWFGWDTLAGYVWASFRERIFVLDLWRSYSHSCVFVWWLWGLPSHVLVCEWLNCWNCDVINYANTSTSDRSSFSLLNGLMQE